MTLAEQADKVTGPIHDYGEQVRDVTTQDTHVERFQFREGGVTAEQIDSAGIRVKELNPRFDNHGGHRSTHATQAIRIGEGLQAQRSQDVGAEDRAIGGRIHQERRLYPGTVTRLNLAADHRPNHLVVTKMPQAA
jgi:hypothetical protein